MCESCRASLTFIMDDEGASFLSDGVIISRKPEHGILEGHGGVFFFLVWLFFCLFFNVHFCNLNDLFLVIRGKKMWIDRH